jgi:2',3'-cyclic-nucleotide 2'-phosphodiesterase (5'-nucleotidase family)
MIRIYHTSDLHDRRGIVAPLRRIRAQRAGLLFDCGDSLRGSQTVFHRNEPIVAEMDAAGYDAQAIGNREFHYLFALLRARARRMQHPLVCTNLEDTKGRALPFDRSLRFEVRCDARDPVAINVFGLLIMQYPIGSAWERLFGWRFLDPWDALEPFVSTIPPGELVVVLSHIGLSLDRKLAALLPRIDLILGGHSHDTLERPEYAGDVPIVHAGPYGKYVSRSELEYDPSRRRFALAGFALEPLLNGTGS